MKSPFSLFRKNKAPATQREDKAKNFLVKRIKSRHGFYVFVLENLVEKRRIYIPHFVFGRFRACLRRLLQKELALSSPRAFERRIGFLNKDYFYFKSSQMDLQNLIIQDLDEPEGSSGYITVNRRDAKLLSEVLYSEALQHPSDVLSSIVSYHKLFQFSFVKTSKSITSDLILRKDILQEISDYKPSLAARSPEKPKPLTEAEQQRRSHAAHFAKSHSPLTKANYQPRLGERFHEKEIKVDYGQLFSGAKARPDNTENEKSKKKADNTSPLMQFATTLSASEVKNFGEGKFRLSLGSDEANEFRNRFICDRFSEFYLGFEIVDTLFLQRKVLKTLRFPLYYLKISVRESGREVRLQAKDDGKIYLNHLALAHVINKFGTSKTEMEGLSEFFNTLLVQQLNIDQVSDRICLCRHLPLADSIFDRTREILFGFQGENGKGGILGNLNFKGIECDLNSVILYRAASLLSPLEQALEVDVDDISGIAHHSVDRFYASLLGKFLTPELAVAEPAKQNAGKPVWIPGRLPKSTQQLIEKLSYHEIVLLEGPPGTGKTYAIRNLLIDYICRGKRVLVVSDQQAAIEALIEKIQEYLYQGDKSGANKESRDALLFSALKVIDRVPDTADSLSEVLSDISPAFKVMEHAEVVQRKTLDKRVSEIDNLIQRYTGEIRDVMKAHLDEATPYYKRLPHKTLEKVNAQALLSFLQVISRGDKNNRGVVQQFIEHRVALIARGMHGCYGYFKLPDIDIERVTTDLQGDISILRAIVDNPPSTQRDFAALIERASFHEIFVFLKQCFLAQIEQRDQRAARVSGVFVNKKNNTLETHASFLVEMVSGQIQLLERLQHWPGELKQILDDIHETIRVADKPTLALSIYYHLRDAEKIRGTGASHSVQQKLEQVEDLIVQRDQLVYERFVARLHGICGSALDNKQRSGTNAITRILALVENLQQFKSIDESGEVFAELRDCLLQTFPVWVLRKQLVPLLLPCQEKSFDLVIVDEATQCRVDDALSLMFRAKKVLVVGDDKQTVLQKDSVVDDYLFKDHELDEHLRSTQARGFKGGGSNIFALVKSIKQAEVMLDEHYRCPADIIQFSNRYVYDNQLKVMQWRLPEQAPAVVVDDSETKLEPSKKPTSGKFKGVETLMIERFLVFVRKAILRLEKDLGRRINLESEVALCYFLLKNEPYVSQALNDFLSQMNRGESILHGAGAALQGKERDYIFYFWDMTRYNTAAFAQGDEEDKRRGELNVLMSRPKKIAFHYLHHAYHNLDHGKANIVKYLGGFLTKSGHSRKRSQGRLPQPQQFFYHALSHSIENSQHRGLLNLQNQFAQQAFNFRENIVVGNALKQVDLVIFPERDLGKVTGVVDLSYFAATEQVGDDVLDYYFQLKRAQPPIDPVFLFNYELADVNSFAFQSLVNKLIS